jgi:hypothetical protein
LDLFLLLEEEAADMRLVVMELLEDLAEELEIREEDLADLETQADILHLKAQLDHQVVTEAVLMVLDLEQVNLILLQVLQCLTLEEVAKEADLQAVETKVMEVVDNTGLLLEMEAQEEL